MVSGYGLFLLNHLIKDALDTGLQGIIRRKAYPDNQVAIGFEQAEIHSKNYP